MDKKVFKAQFTFSMIQLILVYEEKENKPCILCCLLCEAYISDLATWKENI